MACINVSLQRINLIKLTHYDETKKRAHDSHSDILLKNNTSFIPLILLFELSEKWILLHMLQN